MLNKSFLLTGICILIFSVVFGQNKPENVVLKKNVISFNFFGTAPVIGFTYDRILTDHFSAEIGFGYISLGIGAKYFPIAIQVKKVNLHLGLSIVYSDLNAFTKNGMKSPGELNAYLPIGFTFFAERGFHLGFDLGPTVFYTFDDYDAWYLLPWGNIKLGYRF